MGAIVLVSIICGMKNSEFVGCEASVTQCQAYVGHSVPHLVRHSATRSVLVRRFVRATAARYAPLRETPRSIAQRT